MSRKFVDCSHEQHGVAILGILNEVIATSTALFDYHARTPDSMLAWFKVKQQGNFPVIGAITADGSLAGFATYGTFRAWPAYKYSVEHSVYVHKDHRRQGMGRALMQRLIARAEQQQYHLMVAGIDAANTASIALHTALGYTHSGTISQAGFKFGRWLDLALYQRLLKTPALPQDG
jgi:phosphinothricin acetyltransferase